MKAKERSALPEHVINDMGDPQAVRAFCRLTTQAVDFVHLHCLERNVTKEQLRQLKRHMNGARDQ